MLSEVKDHEIFKKVIRHIIDTITRECNITYMVTKPFE